MEKHPNVAIWYGATIGRWFNTKQKGQDGRKWRERNENRKQRNGRNENGREKEDSYTYSDNIYPQNIIYKSEGPKVDIRVI